MSGDAPAWLEVTVGAPTRCYYCWIVKTPRASAGRPSACEYCADLVRRIGERERNG